MDAAAMAPPARHRRRLLPRWIMAWPALAWWVFFFVIPMLWILLYSLGTRPEATEVGPVSLDTLSFGNYGEALSEVFFNVFMITMRTAGVGTLLCALVGFPVAYALAIHVPARWRSILVFLLILPYWTSFLLRTFAWRIILAPQGALSDALRYNFLPFMILPIYVALEKIDVRLVDAAQDLYSSPSRAFRKVVFPLSLSGVFAGTLLTFIPAAGDFVNAQFLGNPNTTMIGNSIQDQFLRQNNYPVASAMSFVLMTIITILVIVYSRFFGTEDLV